MIDYSLVLTKRNQENGIQSTKATFHCPSAIAHCSVNQVPIWQKWNLIRYSLKQYMVMSRRIAYIISYSNPSHCRKSVETLTTPRQGIKYIFSTINRLVRSLFIYFTTHPRLVMHPTWVMTVKQGPPDWVPHSKSSLMGIFMVFWT